MPPSRIISGGQTGVDRGALDAARALGVPIGGWIPHGRWAEDGRVPESFVELRETESAEPSERTRRNVAESDGTLLLSHGPLTGGSALTRELAERLHKPWTWVDLDAPGVAASLDAVRFWLQERRIAILNVAGPRASEDPRAYAAARAFVTGLLATAAAPTDHT